MRSLIAALALLVATSTVAACGEDEEPTATRTTTTAVPATVETTTTTEASTTTTAPARLSSDSRLSFGGIGPIAAGMTLDEVRSAAGVPMVSTELPACKALSTEADPRGVELLFPEDGPLEFVFVREGSPIRSEAGVALGDTEASVLAAHPDAEVLNPEVEVHRVVVKESDNGRRLIFEIERGLVSVMWSGPNGSERADEICS